MSFATLSNTLDDCSAISTLNLTKNPFDSATDGRLNLPALSASPSIFLQADTPGSQKKKGFRWSIDQISKLNPADIDEFPNQDYSSTCEKPEDEEKVQKAISEYFSHGTILPSPWTPDNHVKHVTFSPHPPSTTYISGDEDSINEASHSSMSANTSSRSLVDVCCQTSLTFPPSFDLSKIVDSGFYSYMEEEGNSATRDLNVSSLRRKLFSPDDNQSPVVSRERPPPRPRVTRSILKSPSPKTLLTSSPMQHRDVKINPDSDSLLSKDASSRTSQSPAVSPIKIQTTTPDKGSPHGISQLRLDGALSYDDVFDSEILESSDVNIDPQLLPDVSPIKVAGATSDDENDVRNDPDDGGPMNVAELSHVSMECENEEANISSIEMDDFESQPLAHAHNSRNYSEPEVGDGKTCSISRDQIDDVINFDDAVDDVMTCDAREPSEPITDADVNSDLARADCKFGSNVGNDVMSKNSGDVINSEFNGFAAEGKHGSPLSRVFEKPMDTRGYSTTKLGSWEHKKENMDVCQGVPRGDNGDEALVQRACAAMERADRLVRESCMEKGVSVNKKIGTSAGHLNINHVDKNWNHVDKFSNYLDRPLNHVDSNWNQVDNSWNHVDTRREYVGKGLFYVDKAWHPIDMSTPLVSEKPQNKPRDVNTHVRRSLDTDSYDNLLNSFANSKLESRAFLADEQSVGLGQEKIAELRFLNGEQSRKTRIIRSFSDSGNSASLNSAQDLPGRSGSNSSVGKRFSWPPWHSSRNRYRYQSERSASSPGISSGLRRRSGEDRPRLRRSMSEDFKKYSRRSYRQREDYFSNPYQPDLRRTFRI